MPPAPVAALPPPERVEPPQRRDGAYPAKLLAWLERHKDYPLAARVRRREGEVRLAIVLARNGHLLQATIEKSSGLEMLDTAAIERDRAHRFSL